MKTRHNMATRRGRRNKITHWLKNVFLREQNKQSKVGKIAPYCRPGSQSENTISGFATSYLLKEWAVRYNKNRELSILYSDSKELD